MIIGYCPWCGASIYAASVVGMVYPTPVYICVCRLKVLEHLYPFPAGPPPIPLTPPPWRPDTTTGDPLPPNPTVTCGKKD